MCVQNTIVIVVVLVRFECVYSTQVLLLLLKCVLNACTVHNYCCCCFIVFKMCVQYTIVVVVLVCFECVYSTQLLLVF